MDEDLDPLAPLIDWTGDGRYIIEQPMLSCPCAGLGWLPNEWLLRREPKCDCPAQSDDFIHTLHAVACDCVPCPFCPLEANHGLPGS